MAAAIVAVRFLLLTIPVAAAALLVLFLGAGGGGSERAFHATLADPDLYAGGVYSESFLADPGDYLIRFVPNGDSPPSLSITIEGPAVYFYGEYALQGTLHDTGISEYYTWEYSGPDRVAVPTAQPLTVTVDPRGSTDGSVSVSLIRDRAGGG